jgi:transposase
MTPAGRLRVVQAVMAGEPMRAAAQRWQVDRKSVRKWVARYRAEGDAASYHRDLGYEFVAS